MIILYFLIVPILYYLIKILLFLIVSKNGKFSYDGFSAAGFKYNSKKDIFYSSKNAWQKNFGYAHIYDVLAPIFRMIIDTEPVKFYYNNKNWLITFWKGQYGMVTGAEIGIYCTQEKKVNKKTIYFPAEEQEMLDMHFKLYKKDKLITEVRAKHWWLAIFKMGMFSKPKHLWMDIDISFPNKEMLEAFLKSFKKLGYKNKDFKINNNIFSFKFKKTKTHKVWTRTWFSDFIRQHKNKKNVELYNKYLENYIDDNKTDDYKNKKNSNLIMINDLIPNLLKNSNDKKIENNLASDKQNNIIFLDKDIFTNIRQDHEK